MQPFLITVVGPTAIGKTAMAIALAQHFGCEIISCDSRQFFREMRIGTAVPSEAELASAPHHFIQNKSIHDAYTVGDFEKEALATLAHLFQNNNTAILVGGSGLYVDAVLRGFDDFPEIQKEIRDALSAGYAEQGISFLQEKLQQLDPDYFGTVDTGNPQRMMRALEVSIGTGRPYSSFLQQKENKRDFTPILIGLDADRAELYDRINRRVDLMLAEGLLVEAEKLYPQRERNALQTVGYRELFAYFDGELTLAQAIEEIKKNTRRFAKRQLTWFRRNPDIAWFDFQADPNDIIQHINTFIQNQHEIP